MFESDSDVAARYRERAEELRVIADQMDRPDIRRTLTKVADEYDSMARTRERIAKR